MKSLSTKLTVMVLVISLVGMGLLSGISVVLFRNSLIKQSLEGIGHNTAREAERINGWLEDQIAYINSLAIELSYVEEFSLQTIQPRFQSHVDSIEQYFDMYMAYPDGTVDFASGFVPDYAGGWTAVTRPWYTGAMENPAAVHITSLYTDTQTGGLCLTIAKAVMRNGQAIGVVGADVLINSLTDIVHETDVGQDSYAFLVDGQGGILIHPNDGYGPDADDVFQKLDEIEGGTYAQVWQQRDGDAVKTAGADKVQRYYTAQEISSTGWLLYTAIPVSVVESPVRSLLLIECIIFVVVLVGANLLIRLSVSKMIVRPIAEVTKAAEQLTRGSVDIRMNQEYNDEIGELIRSFSVMADSIREQADMTDRLAGGDLSVQVNVRSESDVMGRALQRLSESLDVFISNIAGAAERVSSGSSQISNSTQVLAEGATRQAGAVDDIFTSVSEIMSQIKRTEETAREASSSSSTIVQNAENGAERMERMIQAVDDINDASASISKVIKAIDDIAFQTNILALNAAVEAARAGVHGKGFAVVADEVRNLAAKSAEAARETDALIKNSITRASEGARIAKETSDSLQEILSGIGGTFQLVDKISDATKEQADSIGRIHEGIEQINAVVSANAATSEECAASVQELSQEAANMTQIVSRFSGARGLSRRAGAPAPAAPPPQDSYPPMLAAAGEYDKY